MIYSEDNYFIPDPPFLISRPYLIILNNILRSLIIIGMSSTMAFGDMREASFRGPNGIYSAK